MGTPQCILCKSKENVVPIVYCFGQISAKRIHQAQLGRIKLRKNRTPVEDYFCKKCSISLSGEKKISKKKECYI